MLSRLGLPISPRTSAHIVVAVCIIVIIFNFLEAVQLAYLWSALKWEPETEWDEWRMNGVRVVVGLVCGYLLWTCCAAFVGLLGALKHKPSYLRFFRDCTIVDIVFSFMFTVVTAFSASSPSTRALLCDQLSRQPELLRGAADAGLNFENCELWFENAVIIFTCVMLVTLVMRVQFTFTLSNFYTRLLRKHRIEPLDTVPRRILLLPASASDIPLLSSSSTTDSPSSSSPTSSNQEQQQHVVVYAPVRQTLETAQELGAVEAWVSNHRRGHSHSHSHSRSRSYSGSNRTGRIQLEIRDGEGLLPDRPAPSSLSSVSEESNKRTNTLEEWRAKGSLKRV